MEAWRFALWFAGAFVVLRLLPILVALPGVLRLRMRETFYEWLDEGAIDPELREWLREVAAPLRARGFEELGSFVARGGMYSSGDSEQKLALTDEEGTVAEISVSPIPDVRLPWRIDLTTRFVDGTQIVTLNALGHSLLGELEDVEYHDPLAATPADLLSAHRTRCAGHGERLRLLRDEIPALEDAEAARLLKTLRARGDLVDPGHDGAARPSIRSALRLIRRLRAGTPARERFLRARAASLASGKVSDPPVDARWLELQYHRARTMTSQPLDPGIALALLAVTAVAFLLGLGWVQGFGFSVALLGVVALHELGHWVAMRAFGYRDTSVLFLPFVGAIAMGRKETATLSEQIGVLLAGPVPGLVLAFAISAISPGFLATEHGVTLVLLLLLVNASNLLPVMPLDGGRIVDLLFIGTRPRLALILALVGALGLFGLAAYLRDPILAGFAALVVWLGLRRRPALELAARLSRQLGSAGGSTDLTGAAFRCLASDRDAPFARKLEALAILESQQALPRATKRLRAGWATVYGISLVAAIVGSFWLMVTVRSARSGGSWAEQRKALLEPTETRPLSCDGSGLASLEDVPESTERRRYVLTTCRAAPEVVAALARELDDFVSLEQEGFCLQAPWQTSGIAERELAVQEKARALYTSVLQRDLAVLDSSSGPVDLESPATREARLAALTENAGADEIDLSIRQLYRQAWLEESEHGGALTKLEVLLGVCPADFDEERGERERRQRLVAFESEPSPLRILGSSTEPRAFVEEMRRFLCSLGCEVDYRVGRAKRR